MRILVALLAAWSAIGCLPPFVPPLELAACDEDARAVPIEGSLVLDERDAPFRLAFFPELFPPSGIEVFDRQMEELRDELETGALATLAPPGTFALDVFRVDPASERRDGRMLASCKEADALGGERPFWRVDLEEAWRHAPDADAIVVVVNSVGARANAPYASASALEEDGLITLTRERGRSVVMGRFDERGTLTHELGHALFDLGDEYAEADRCFDPQMGFADPNDVLTPNLTLHEAGARFRSFDVAAAEGGARHDRCVFHPAGECVMRTSAVGVPFCAVCAGRIAEVLVRHTEADVTAPRCQVRAPTDPTRVANEWLAFEIEALDESAPISALVTFGDRAMMRAVSDLPSLRVASLIDAEDIAVAPARLVVQCSDRLGNLSTASLGVARAQQ